MRQKRKERTVKTSANSKSRRGWNRTKGRIQKARRCGVKVEDEDAEMREENEEEEGLGKKRTAGTRRRPG